MFCPQCGLRQVSNEARFCSSCGFQLNVVGELLSNAGQLPWRPPPAPPAAMSARQKGVRQGAMLMLSTFLVVPVIGILFVALMGLPGEIAGLAAVMCFMGGLLRILYALFLEDPTPQQLAGATPQQQQAYVPPPSIPNYLGTPVRGSTLPPAQTPPAQAQPPRRLDTGELSSPHSVTDHTTRLLGKQPDDKQNQ